MSEPVTPTVPTEFITRPGADPHPVNAQLRDQCPVHKIDYPPGAAAYVVMAHETVKQAFRDPRLSKRLDNAPRWFRERTLSNSPVIAQNMLLADPPEHTRLRKLVRRAFLPRRMDLLRPKVQQIADELIDQFPDAGEVDLMTAFALPLPLMVICDFIGVPYADRRLFENWGRVLSQSPSQQGANAGERRVVNDEVVEYFTKTLELRRDDPREDLCTDLIRAAEEDTSFTDHELISTMMFLIIAGHKTTANLIANGTEALLRHPDQLELLRGDLSLVESAVEEFLRFEGPVDRGTLRVAAEDLRLGGVDIPKESFVHLSVACANRDGDVFDDADRLDITRESNRHVAFGYGAHFCAGARLARLEGHVAFPTLLRRLAVLELAVEPEALTWVADSSISRGLQSLPVRIAKAGADGATRRAVACPGSSRRTHG